MRWVNLNIWNLPFSSHLTVILTSSNQAWKLNNCFNPLCLQIVKRPSKLPFILLNIFFTSASKIFKLNHLDTVLIGLNTLGLGIGAVCHYRFLLCHVWSTRENEHITCFENRSEGSSTSKASGPTLKFAPLQKLCLEVCYGEKYTPRHPEF